MTNGSPSDDNSEYIYFMGLSPKVRCKPLTIVNIPSAMV